MATKELVLLLFCHDVLILLVKDVVSSQALVLTSRFRWLGSLMKIRRPCWLLLVSSSAVMMGVVLNQMVLLLKLGAAVLFLHHRLVQILKKFKIVGVGVIVMEDRLVKILGVLVVIVVERSYLRSKERLSTCKSNNWKETRWYYCECS